VLLYALRYERQEGNALHRFVDLLQANGVGSEKLRLVPELLKQCGASARQGDLYQTKDVFASAKKAIKRGVKGVENVYTQHQPFLLHTLENLAKNKLSEAHYPYVTSYSQLPAPNRAKAPQDVIVFLFGGATYEEARFVAQFNEQRRHQPGSSAGVAGKAANAAQLPMNVLLGGTSILDSRTFLDDVLGKGIPRQRGQGGHAGGDLERPGSGVHNGGSSSKRFSGSLSPGSSELKVTTSTKTS